MNQEIINNLQELVDHFKQHGTKQDEYNTRSEYIDKLFGLLGWDMYNSRDKAPAHLKQVLREDTVYIDGGAKAPDYSFRIEGKRQFFVEAKKPSVNIHDNPVYALQARSYGYSASEIPLVILTDFQEFSVYDATIKPKESDNAGIARIKYFTCDDYTKPEFFQYLWDTFSYEAVLKGSLKKYLQETKKGSESFDTAFLKSLSQWRLKLADAIFLKNKDLHEIQVNFAVQKIMNRMVFLRFAEDRGTSRYESLKSVAGKSENRYQALKILFDEARTVYNSDLFGTIPNDISKEEKDRYFANKKLLEDITIDDKTLKEIIDDLYFPKSPYAFSVIPIELLGTIYERFLGQKIIRGKYNRAEAVDKIEHRKGQGIYYTPSYIVDYIIQNTLGKQLEGKNPEDIKDLSIVDPACGSGSFLIAVYNKLLEWYLHYYTHNTPKKHIKDNKIIQQGDDFHLTLEEKQQILLRHVYGVDLDTQAVEVSKLSLMLRLMEGQNSAKDSKLTFLPSLEDNIKWGNSLIGTDYTKNIQLDLFGMEEQHKTKVFDWDKAFPKIFEQGGFDCVVGNPPYIFNRDKAISEEYKEYYVNHYDIKHKQFNVSTIFVEKSWKITNSKGVVGFIIPKNCLTMDLFDPFRKFLLSDTGELGIVEINKKVFRDASVDTCILIIGKEKTTTKAHISIMNDVASLTEASVEKSLFIENRYIITTSLAFQNTVALGLLTKINKNSAPLSSFAFIVNGLQAYEVGAGVPIQTKEMGLKRIYHAQTKIDNTYHKYLQGADISRYNLEWTGEWLSHGVWLSARRPLDVFEHNRILVRQIPNKLPYCFHACFVAETFLNDKNLIIIRDFKNYNSHFILGVLNSRLLSFWFAHSLGKLGRGVFPQFKAKELAQFPIPALDMSNKNQKKQHDELVAKVDQMLNFHKKLHSAKDLDKPTINTQINLLDRQIDDIVYSLYGLTDDEIKVIEG